MNDIFSVLLFIFGIFWTIGNGFYFSNKYEKEGCILRSYFRNFKRMTVIGILLTLVYLILCIPALLLAYIVIGINYIIIFTSENLPKIIYKK